MAKLPERRQSDERLMKKTNDKELALVRASSTALAGTGSQALARRGLHDLEVTEQKARTPLDKVPGLGQGLVEKLDAAGVTTVEALADMTPEQLGAIEGIGPGTVEKISFAVINYLASQAQLLFCLDHHCAHHRCPNVMHLDFALVPFTNHSPEGLRSLIEKGPIALEYRDEARFLFCLDHQCTHNWCPNVPHLDFALVPLRDIRPEVLRRSIEEGPLGREYDVVQTDTGWEVVEDSEVGWEPEPRPDGTTCLKVPESLRGKLHGPFFTISEAWQFAEERRLGEHNQVVTLPRVVPHVWCSDACCSFCGESDPAQHGRPCPKRSCYTWYEILGVSERADQSQIEDAHREVSKAWDLKRLRYRDDIRYEYREFGYSETQLRWFNAAHTVLGDPIKRQEYDAELLRRRRSNP